METPEKPDRFRELKFSLRMLLRSKIVMVSIGVIVFFYIMALAPGLFDNQNPNVTHLDQVLLPPSSSHVLGTDEVGRDLLTRVIWGAQYSMSLGLIVVLLSTSIGVPLGAIAAYAGGKVDNIIMRITDMFLAFPGIILAVFLSYALGRGFESIIIALGAIYWTYTARVVRSTVLVEKQKEYVTAARALGMSNFRILFDEILPNSIQPVIVLATLGLGDAIISAAGLSFVGVGIQPPLADWGNLMSDGTAHLLELPLLALVPGLCMIAVVLSVNIVGDGLRDALDPRLRREIR